MNLRVSHEILVTGPDFEACRHKVLRFFKKNILVRYDVVQIDAAGAVNAQEPFFWEGISRGEAANRKVLAEFVSELEEDGFRSMHDILGLDQGYRSKVFHTIAHLVDGFFGIDSCFYNLVDDSHWVSETLRQQIESSPADYWLLKAAAESKGKTADRLHILRSVNPEE